jgi:hypothetical protein
MQFENSIQPVNSIFLRNESTRLNQQRQAFHDIFRNTLSGKSSSRPPKLELSGVLVPCQKILFGEVFKFKLETDSGEYFLSLSDTQMVVAERAEWEEVIVKGYLGCEGKTIEVEKISLARSSEGVDLSLTTGDLLTEIEELRRTIHQQGKLGLAAHELAS